MDCQILNDILVCKCDKGFELNNNQSSINFQICDDINECLINPLICGSNSICVNEYGSYSCQCQMGFIPKYSDTFTCEDIDECSNECNNNCNLANSYCQNLIGSYVCDCKDGFLKDQQTNTCIDINECYQIVINCDKNSKCENTYGSYKCICETGFYGNGSYCEDINECIDIYMEPVCKSIPNSVCINFIGSYECRCLDGYRSISNECIDIDECSEYLFECNDNSLCHNSNGSYSCECNIGYKWSNLNKKCEDINECIFNTNSIEIYSSNVCDDNSFCINTIGSFQCECKSGWNKTDLNYCSGSLNYYLLSFY